MSKPLFLETDPDLYFLKEAAELISDQVEHDKGHREQLASEMRKAIQEGLLHAYNFRDGELLRKFEPTTPLCVRPAGVNTWLKTTNWGFTWNIQAPASTESNASTAEQRQNEKQQPPDWITKAKEMAWQIIKRQKAIDVYPSQIDIADEIARKFRADGVFGSSCKPLSGEYIKRWALKGISSEQGKQLSTTTARGKRGNF